MSPRAEMVMLNIVSKMSQEEFTAVKGCGRKTIIEVQGMLALHGMSFREDEGTKEFAEAPFEISELKVKYAIRYGSCLVRHRNDEFIVVEYTDGCIFKLPVKDLKRGSVRVSGRRERIPFDKFVPGEVIRVPLLPRLIYKK